MNLSAWALRHRSLTLFLILAVAAAGVWAYLSLGRGEDPPFTIKQMVIQAGLARRLGGPDGAVGGGPDRTQAAGSAVAGLRRKQRAAGPCDPDGFVARRHAAGGRDQACGTRCARRSATSRRPCRRACKAPISTMNSATSSALSTPLPATGSPCRSFATSSKTCGRGC